MSQRPSSISGQVSTMRNMDIRRLWGKLHNMQYRENCYPYYREASFDVNPTSSKTSNKGFFKRVIANSTEKKAILLICGVMGLGIGVTRLLAVNSQTNTQERVESYIDNLKSDWNKYQEKINAGKPS